MKKRYYYYGAIVLCCYPAFAQTQLYRDASVNLPDVGAKTQAMDVRAADLDRDGDLDIILANEFQPNTLLFNDGNGTFTNASTRLPQLTRDSEDIAVADFDGDGDLDLIFCSEDDINFNITPTHEYYLNDGTGTFRAAPYVFPDSEANAVLAADLNNDGALDVLFGNNGQNTLFINRGDGTFVNETPTRLPALLRTTQDLALADVDRDGDLDLFVGNEDGNVLLMNSGQGVFTDETAMRLPQGVNLETRKVAIGDVDTDGDLDILLANVGFRPGKVRQNRLYLNDGSGKFTDVTATHLPPDNDHTLEAILVDVDDDRDLDAVLGNFAGAPIKVYLNDGTGRFTHQSTAVLGQLFYRDALGIIAADFNQDGAQDLYICDRYNPNLNRKDILFLKQGTTASKDAPPVAERFRLFPNPTRQAFTLAVENAPLPQGSFTFTLLDTAGKTLQTLQPTRQDATQVHFTLASSLQAGTYFIQIKNNQYTQPYWLKLVIV